MGDTFFEQVLAHASTGRHFAVFTEALGIYDSKADDSNTRRSIGGEHRIRAEKAWSVGEALGVATWKAPPLLPGSSGLLALYWYGYLEHFVGVIACVDRAALSAHAQLFERMLHCIEETELVSRFDVVDLPSALTVTDGSVAPELVSSLDSSPPLKKDVLDSEGLILRTRAEALATWDYPPALREELERAARHWFALGKDRLRLITGRPAPLHRAYAFGTSEITPRRKRDFVLAELLHWIHAVQTPNDPRSQAVFIDGEVVLDEATLKELEDMFNQLYP